MRAQTSIEFLMILSVALLALFVFMSLSQSETIAAGTSKIKNEGANVVKEVGSAVEIVYSQGVGARKLISISMPYGIEPGFSSVGNKTIKLRVSGNDYAAQVSPEVYGNLPTTPGRHDVWIISEGDKVRVGTDIIAVDKEAINMILNTNASRTDTFTVRNVWNQTVNVNIAKDWSHAGRVDFALSESSFALTSGGSRTITVTFSSATDALVNYYTGSLQINADDGFGNTQNITLPVSGEISVGQGVFKGPPLIIIPSEFSANMNRNTTTFRTFQVCTNMVSSLSSVDFTASQFAPGSWVNNISPLGALGPNRCLPKTIFVTVPIDADITNYSGYIYATGSGFEGAADSIALNIQVGGSAFDSQAPSITNISVFPNLRKIFVGDPVAIRATADDSMMGNNSISLCKMQVDGGSWFNMVPSDGFYNSPKENASFMFFAGFGIGSHNVQVNCTDVKNNTGSLNTTFKVYKDFLFVTQNSTPTANETAWINWINADWSFEGYGWKYDTIDSTAFIAGPANLNYYSTLVAERYVAGEATRMNSFATSGGSIILLGHALAEGPNGLGVGKAGNAPASESTANIVDNTHYITLNLSTGSQAIKTNSSENGRFWKDFSGTMLVKSVTGAPPSYYLLGVAGRKYFWGPNVPTDLNQVGLNISVRMFDHARNASVIN